LITGSPTKLNIKHFFSGRQQYEPVIEISTIPPPILLLTGSPTELATVSLKVASRKRRSRRKCTLKSYDRFTNS
jgi:hypothetical protein